MQLLNIQDHKDLVQAVDAKELYEKLGLNLVNWSRWHTLNIEQNPFATNGLDFIAFFIENNGRSFTNYLLSIDFAKKLAMQVKTDKGEQVRDYFLACERQVRQPVQQLPTNYIEALEQLIIKEKALIAAQPKIAHYDKVVERDTLLNATTVAQSVGIKSANALNKILEAMRVYNMTCKRGRAFQSWFVDKGYGEMKQGDTGHHQALFTTKGQAWIIEKLGGVISN